MAAKLFEVLAGKSSDFFKIGGVEFQAAPLTLMEYGEFLALPDGLDAKAAFLADKLRRRVRNHRDDPAAITEEWVIENLPLPMLGTLQHVLLYGEMPGEEGQKKA